MPKLATGGGTPEPSPYGQHAQHKQHSGGKVRPELLRPASNPRDEIRRQALLQGVPVNLALAVAFSASGFDQTKRDKGRIGLFQIPSDRVPVMLDASNWRDNIYMGVQRIRFQWEIHKNWMPDIDPKTYMQWDDPPWGAGPRPEGWGTDRESFPFGGSPHNPARRRGPFDDYYDPKYDAPNDYGPGEFPKRARGGAVPIPERDPMDAYNNNLPSSGSV